MLLVITASYGFTRIRYRLAAPGVTDTGSKADDRFGREYRIPAAKPPEFRRRAVELARLREKPIAEIGRDLGISESCLRRWMDQADVDEGRTSGLTSDERAELARLRRENRVQAMEIEILKRASAYFARENVLPK